jgi:hypothetical protein
VTARERQAAFPFCEHCGGEVFTPCNSPMVLVRYLTSYYGPRRLLLACPAFVRDHPTEFVPFSLFTSESPTERGHNHEH